MTSEKIIDVAAYDDSTLDKVRQGIRRFDPFATDDAITGLISEIQSQGILFRETLPDDVSRGDVSDRHHTFNDLYDHRRALTAVLAGYGATTGRAMTGMPEAAAWRSKAHHPDDGPMFDGSFIVGVELDTGTITYHYGLEHWDDFAAVPELEHAPRWDGAGPPETIVRLLRLAKLMAEGPFGTAG